MDRTNRLVIPLKKSERERIDRLARRQRLPTATAARRILLDLADDMEEENQQYRR
jgi:hypothetical protein